MRWRFAFAAMLLLALSGCSVQGIGRSLGRGAIDGASTRLDDPKTHELFRRTADSLAAVVAVAIREDVRPAIDSTVQAVLERGQGALDRAQDSLAAAVRTDLSSSLQDLVKANLETTGEEGRHQVRLLMASVSEGIERDLAPSLQHAVVTATDAMMERLSVGVRDKLSAAAESAVARSVRVGGKTADTAAKGSPTLKWVRTFAIVLLVVIALSAFVKLYLEYKRSHTALDVVTAGINRAGTSDLKDAIKASATSRGVEPWLHTFLERKQRL